MNYPHIAGLLQQFYELIDADTDISGTIYESIDELEDDIQTYIEEMLDNNGQWLEYLTIQLSPTGHFSKIAQQNQWFENWDEIYQSYLSAIK